MARTKGAKTRSTSPSAIAAAQLKAEVINYRMQGFQLHQIADFIGKSKSRVHQIIHEALEDIVNEPLDKYRATALARLDMLLPKFLSRASEGDPVALASVLSIESRKDKLMGFNPAAPAVSGNGAFLPGSTLNGSLDHRIELVFVEPERRMVVDHKPLRAVEEATVVDPSLPNADESVH